MKTLKNIILAGAMALIGWTAMGQVYYSVNSFQTTNYLTSATQYTGWPTNYAGTNGQFVANGNGVAVFQQRDVVGINVQGQVVDTNAVGQAIQLWVIGSMSANPPAVVYWTTNSGFTGYAPWQTNSAVPIQNDWMTTTPIYLAFNLPLASAANTLTTNWFNYQTNLVLNGTQAPSWNFIGIYGLSNALTGGEYINGFNVTVSKKKEAVALTSP
jgi:hypothetical protein